MLKWFFAGYFLYWCIGIGLVAWADSIVERKTGEKLPSLRPLGHAIVVNLWPFVVVFGLIYWWRTKNIPNVIIKK